MAIYRDEAGNIISRKKENVRNSEARIRANHKYTNEHYTEKKVRFRNDFFNDVVKPYIDNTGVSINGLIVRAVAYCIAHNIDLTADSEDSAQDS